MKWLSFKRKQQKTLPPAHLMNAKLNWKKSSNNLTWTEMVKSTHKNTSNMFKTITLMKPNSNSKKPTKPPLKPKLKKLVKSKNSSPKTSSSNGSNNKLKPLNLLVQKIKTKNLLLQTINLLLKTKKHKNDWLKTISKFI